jgi:tRNA A58 N-methylase Trm61
MRERWILVALLLVLACERGELELERPERIPSPLTPVEGAAWLERPGRELEERPALVLQVMDLRNGDWVAEVGSATGYFTRRIARRVAPDGVVYAVDIQPEMLELMTRKLEEEGIENVIPVLGEPTDPKLPPEAFDWILLVDTYHEFQQPYEMLSRIREAMAPDGRVALVGYRLEGATAEHIRLEQRMSVNQILAEWLPAGFDLVERVETLPSQHLLIFQRSQE